MEEETFIPILSPDQLRGEEPITNKELNEIFDLGLDNYINIIKDSGKLPTIVGLPEIRIVYVKPQECSFAPSTVKCWLPYDFSAGFE